MYEEREPTAGDASSLKTRWFQGEGSMTGDDYRHFPFRSVADPCGKYKKKVCLHKSRTSVCTLGGYMVDGYTYGTLKHI